MENKTFQAKIKVDVISRLKNSLNEYSNPDIYISSVTIDGESSDYIPTSGYYDMTATCSKGSNLTWEPLSKTITYNSGSYVNDNCSLVFTSSTDYPLLSEMPVGSYVKYTGNNGCSGNSCLGQNANYVNDNDMGYCGSSTLPYKYYANGWRIAYISNRNVHLISGGATDCMCTDAEGLLSSKGCTSNLDEANINKLLNDLQDVNSPHAYFESVIVYYSTDSVINVNGVLEGTIIKEKRGSNGFGYDPIIVPNGYNLSLAQMSLEEKNKISHRAKALHNLKKYFNEIFK
jgi:hypothetical protein